MKLRWLLALLFLSVAAHATVTTKTITVSYTCGIGSTGPFQFTFPISDPTAMTVTLNNAVLVPSAYTIVPVNNSYDNGGSVTLIDACTISEPIKLSRITPILQTSAFRDNMPNPMKSFELGLDKVTEIEQEITQIPLINASCPPGQVIQTVAPLICVDNTAGSAGNPAAPAFAVNFANSSVTAFQGDPNITINPTTHTLTAPVINGSVNTEINPTAFPYLADNTGVDDATAAINAAFAACPVAQAGQCSVVLPIGTYKVTGILDIAGTGSTGSTPIKNRMLRGMGKGSIINCVPGGAQTACLRSLNGTLITVKDLSIYANSNVVYDFEDTVANGGTSAEIMDLVNVFLQGGQYGVALGPDTTLDISGVNIWGSFFIGQTTAAIVSGNGASANVLNNFCHGCNISLSGGDGFVGNGGGMSFIGGGSNENVGIDFHILVPSSQPLNISSWRSEGSAAFFKQAAGENVLTPVFLDNDTWASDSLEGDNCVFTDTSANPVTITNSQFNTIASATSGIKLCIAPTGGQAFPQVVTLNNVGTNNPSFPAILAGLTAVPGLQIHSVGDYYVNPTTNQVGAGSGKLFFNGIYSGNVASDSGFFSPGGVLGNYQNLLTYSQHDSGNPNWSVAFCNAPTPPTVTANTSDVTNPTDPSVIPGNNAEKIVSQGVFATGCSGTYNAEFQNYSLSAGIPYTYSVWLRGAAGGEIIGLVIGTPGIAGANIESDFTLTTSWVHYTFSGILTSTHSAPFGVVKLLNSASATYYVFGESLEQSSSRGIYIHTIATNAPLTSGTATTAILDFGLTPGTSPVCPNGTGGALTTSGCASAAFQVNGTPLTSASTVNFQAGTNITLTNPSAGNILVTASATAATAFSALTSATNTTAAMLCGAGCTLGPTSTGAVTANALSGTPSATLASATQDICTVTIALPTGSIAPGGWSSVTGTCTNALTTDVVKCTPTATFHGVTGYDVTINSGNVLTIDPPYVSSSATITIGVGSSVLNSWTGSPGAMSLKCAITR